MITGLVFAYAMGFISGMAFLALVLFIINKEIVEWLEDVLKLED